MHAHLAIEHDFPLKSLNTFGIDAKARRYLRVGGAADLAAVMRDQALWSLPRLVLGGGSNVLRTRDFDGLVLHMTGAGRAIVGETATHVLVRGAAGENWHGFVQYTLEQGLGGLENMSLIPGTLGAAPIQNIGAYGAEIKDVFHSLTAFDMASGELRTMTAADCRFGYRDSVFKRAEGQGLAIVDVTFALPRGWQPNLRYAELAQALSVPPNVFDDYITHHLDKAWRATERAEAAIVLAEDRVARADANRDRAFVLVVDEINRGNIPKIFGELLFLLEYRDVPISLQYSDQHFILPPNIFVIGTMNTADRSIALVDAALRLLLGEGGAARQLLGEDGAILLGQLARAGHLEDHVPRHGGDLGLGVHLLAGAAQQAVGDRLDGVEVAQVEAALAIPARRVRPCCVRHARIIPHGSIRSSTWRDGRASLDWASMDGRERLPELLAGVGCAACGATLDAERIAVLAQRDDLAFVEFRCDACGSTSLGLVVADETDARPRADTARYGEFGPEEELTLAAGPPIGDEDVARMRAFLATYDGDLRALLADRGPGPGAA